MKLTTDEFEQIADQTLRDAGAFQVPVPIDKVARHLNLTIEAVHLEDFAGVLVVNGDSGAIGYNSAHSVVRRRFTIAHEISHFLLHARRDGKPQVFADRRVAFRRPEDDHASAAYRRDAEANQLGAALLMPRSAVLQEIETHCSDLDEDKDMKLLAALFRVSIPALAKRLKNMGLLLF